MADDERQAGPSNPQPKAAPSPAPADAPEKPQVPSISGLNASPLMHSALLPDQNLEDEDHGPGIYAIPYMGPVAGFDPTTLIPLKYKIPTRPASGGGAIQGQGQEGRQQHGPQRQPVVRRFHFEFHLDLALILKLAAVVFLFSQDGSKQKLTLLVFFAFLVYLYQTGALTPLIRWLQRAGAPPQARPPIQPPNPPLPDPNNPPPEENAGVENHNQNQPIENPDPQPANENQPEPAGRGVNLFAVVKEIQMFVVGFVTSLLPGFHHND